MAQWAYWTMGHWANGLMDPRAHRPTDPWAHEPMGPWAHEPIYDPTYFSHIWVVSGGIYPHIFGGLSALLSKSIYATRFWGCIHPHAREHIFPQMGVHKHPQCMPDLNHNIGAPAPKMRSRARVPSAFFGAGALMLWFMSGMHWGCFCDPICGNRCPLK